MEEMKGIPIDDYWAAIIVMMCFADIWEGGLNHDGCTDTESSISD